MREREEKLFVAALLATSLATECLKDLESSPDQLGASDTVKQLAVKLESLTTELAEVVALAHLK